MLRRMSFLVVVFLVFGFSHAYADDQDEKAKLSETNYPAYSGPKKRIAVTKFDNKAHGNWGNWQVGDGMAEMLTTELMNTGRFIVVERNALQDVVDEQKLGQSGLVQKDTVTKIGQILGAQIIVRGVVSEFEQNESGGGKGISFGGISLGHKSANAHVAVDIRLIDTTSGQVLYSHNAAGRAESSSMSLGVNLGGVSFGGDEFKKTPIGQATRQAIADAVRFIIDRMEQVPFSAKVVKAEGRKVYINAGSLMNIKPGTKFRAFSVGEDIVDPETGLKLGSEEKALCTVEVRDVQEKFSIGVIAEGNANLKRGDVLKLQ